MLRRGVQRVEVVKGQLCLRSLRDSIAHADEDVDELPRRLREGMQGADRRRVAWKGDVDALSLTSPLELTLLEHPPLRLDRGRERRLDLVGDAAHGPAILFRKVAETRSRLGERSPSSEDPDPCLLQAGKIGRLVDTGHSLG